MKNKHILFITTKNIEYIRNVQEINLLKKDHSNEIKIIYSRFKTNTMRIIAVNIKLLLIHFKKYDEIFIGFLPQFLLSIIYKKMKSKNITIDFFISIYETLVYDRKKIKKDSFLAELLRKKDIYVISKANKVIVDTNEDKKYFERYFGLTEEKAEILYINANKLIYNEKVESIQDNKLKNKFVVLFFGTILPLQGLDVILGATELLKSNKDIVFCIIGKKRKIKNKNKYKNVIFVDWQRENILARYIKRADICLGGHFSNEIDKAKRTIPGKAYIYYEMKKEIILGNNLANKEIFKEDNEKIHYVKMGNKNELANEIEKIYKSKNRGEKKQE